MSCQIHARQVPTFLRMPLKSSSYKDKNWILRLQEQEGQKLRRNHAGLNWQWQTYCTWSIASSCPLQHFDIPAIRWSELKDKWPHLHQMPFESVSKRRQIDVMIGSDHPVFHHLLKEACGDQPNDPIAHLTNLGWVCFGPTLVEEFRATLIRQ